MSFKTTIRLIFLLLLVALICIVYFGATGCSSILKTKERKTVDSTAVTQVKKEVIDTTKSGAVSHRETNEKEAEEWWRRVEEFDRRDTTIILPTRIIYEGGTRQRQTETQQTDSSWILRGFKAMADSLHSVALQVQQSSKTKETDNNNLFKWLFIGYIVFKELLQPLIRKLLAGYTITKKVIP